MAWHGNLLVVVVCCQVLSKDSEALRVGQGVDVFGIEEEGRSIRDSGGGQRGSRHVGVVAGSGVMVLIVVGRPSAGGHILYQCWWNRVWTTT